MQSNQNNKAARVRLGCLLALICLTQACAAEVGTLDSPTSNGESHGQEVQSLVSPTPETECRTRRFGDVIRSSDEAGEEIYWLAERCAIAGYADGTFRPSNAVTRAEFATLLGALIEETVDNGDPEVPSEDAVLPFPDVRSHWARYNIARAHAAGFMNGYPDGTFRPNRPITRQEVLVAIAAGMRMKDADRPSAQTFALRFGEASDLASWADQGVRRAFRAGLLSNEDLNYALRPTASASRADVASFIYYAYDSATNPNSFARSGTFPRVRVSD